MKAGRSPPICCFLLFNCLNPLAQFNKMYPCTLKNLTPEDQMEIVKTPTNSRPISKKTNNNKQNLRLRDAKITPNRDPLKTLPRFLD